MGPRILDHGQQDNNLRPLWKACPLGKCLVLQDCLYSGIIVFSRTKPPTCGPEADSRRAPWPCSQIPPSVPWGARDAWGSPDAWGFPTCCPHVGDVTERLFNDSATATPSVGEPWELNLGN